MVRKHIIAAILLVMGRANGIPMHSGPDSEDGSVLRVTRNFDSRGSTKAWLSSDSRSESDDSGAEEQQVDPPQWFQTSASPRPTRRPWRRPRPPGDAGLGGLGGPTMGGLGAEGRTGRPMAPPAALSTPLTQTITIIGGSFPTASLTGGTAPTGGGLMRTTYITLISQQAAPPPVSSENPRPSPKPTTPVESGTTSYTTISVDTPTIPTFSPKPVAADEDRVPISEPIPPSSASSITFPGLENPTQAAPATLESTSSTLSSTSSSETTTASPISTPPSIAESSKTDLDVSTQVITPIAESSTANLPSSSVTEAAKASPVSSPPSVPQSTETSLSSEIPLTSTTSAAMVTVVTLPGPIISSRDVPTMSELSSVAEPTTSPILATPAAKSSSATVPHAPFPLATNQPSPITITGSTLFNVSCPGNDAKSFSAPGAKTFRLECDTDHAAGDLSMQFDVKSWGRCAEACAAATRCKAFSWVPGPAAPCYLKSSVGPGNMKQGVWGGVLLPAGNGTVATPISSPSTIVTMPIPAFLNSSKSVAPISTVLSPPNLSVTLHPSPSANLSIPLGVTAPTAVPTTFLTIAWTTSFTDTLNWGGPIPKPAATSISSSSSLKSTSNTLAPYRPPAWTATYSEIITLSTLSPALPITAGLIPPGKSYGWPTAGPAFTDGMGGGSGAGVVSATLMTGWPSYIPAPNTQEMPLPTTVAIPDNMLPLDAFSATTVRATTTSYYTWFPAAGLLTLSSAPTATVAWNPESIL